MIIEIPGRQTFDIQHIIFDYNGTIALDGKVMSDVKLKIQQLAGLVNFHVVTADTYGTAERELQGIPCTVINLANSPDFSSKVEYLNFLGSQNTLSVGNGFNDKELLKQSRIGVALIQDEGLCVETLIAADIVCKSVMDVFAYIEKPNRLKATLRA